MPSRGVTVLVAALLIVTGGLWWRSLSGRASRSTRALIAAIHDLARGEGPLAFVSEGDEIDRTVLDASRQARGLPMSLVPPTPDAVDRAAAAGTLLAGPTGRAYLEVLGFELSVVGDDSGGLPFPLARAGGRLRCAPVRGDAWSPLPGLEYTGRLGVTLPPDHNGMLVLIVGDHLPLEVEAVPVDKLPLRVTRNVVPSVASAPPDYWIENRSPYDAPSRILRLVVHASPEQPRAISIRLGRRAPRTLARLDGYESGARATVCAAPAHSAVAFRQSSVLSVHPADREFFGAGWSDVMDVPGVGSARWMGAHGAVLLTLAGRGAVRVVIRAYRAPGKGEAEVWLRINDMVDTPAIPLREGLHPYEWTIPSGAWAAGTNEALVRVSGEGADHLLALTGLELARQP